MTQRLTLKREKASLPLTPAASNPIARVLVDTGIGHLDEPYDYLVLQSQDETAQPGVRVRVKFARKLVDGWILERRADTSFAGKLAPLSSVVSPEVLLTPALVDLCQQIADRQAGGLLDVVRTAIPKRHAKVESEPSPPAHPSFAPPELPERYPLLATFFNHGAARAVWNLAPGGKHFEEVAAVVQRTAASGGGVLVVLPDERDVKYLEQALGFSEGVAVLRADLSPAERYRRYLRVSRGADKIVIGTRAASFAPVHNLSLMIVWDDGDSSHYEPHAPTWNTLDVLAMRSHLEKVPLISAGFAVSVDAAKLLKSGWAKYIGCSDKPKVVVADEEVARVSTKTWKLIKESLVQGPVLISVARTGYLPALQCRKCGSAALCQCGGRIQQQKSSTPQCHVCGALHQSFACSACGGSGYRAPVIGIERSAEEIGKAFPSTVIRHSTGEKPIDFVPNKPAIILSTQGVEPLCNEGYAAVIILDTYLSLYRSDLRAEEDARRRWFNAASLVRHGGTVAISGDSAHPAIQALVRWSPTSSAERELENREELHFSPAWQIAVVETSVNDPELPQQLEAFGEVLGPLPIGESWRYIIRNQRPVSGPLKAWATARAIKRQPVKVRINPYNL